MRRLCGRRDFMKVVGLGAAAVLAPGCLSGAVRGNDTSARKPNIVLIYGDDVGAMDVGFSGGRACPTPNLDKLAGQGIVFTDAYSMTATCAPSRMSLVTGQYPTRFGRFTVHGNRTPGDPAHMRLIPPPRNSLFSEDFPTFADALKTVGYTTAVMGKWHMSKCDPENMGFDVNIGGSGIGNPGVAGHKGYHSPYDFQPGLKQDKPGEYLTDRLTDEAIKFVAANRERPFLLYLSYYTIHTPLQPREDLLAKAKTLVKERGMDYGYSPEMIGMIMALDENVGRLVDKIDELGLDENTLIIFTGDNGSYSTNSVKTEPLRNAKSSFYEGGIRVPMCTRWTGHINFGQIDKTPVAQIDYFPTFLALSGAKAPAASKLDGVNLLPLMLGQEKLPDRPIYWHFPVYKGGIALGTAKNTGDNPLYATIPGSSIRRGKWKLMEFFGTGNIELYNLEADIGEKRNLAKENPEIASKLLAELHAWQKATNAPIATEKNPKFDAAALQAAIDAAKKKRKKQGKLMSAE